jgi:hypothetical protein
LEILECVALTIPWIINTPNLISCRDARIWEGSRGYQMFKFSNFSPSKNIPFSNLQLPNDSC